MSEVIVRYIVELLISGNLYFATNFIKLSAQEQNLCPFIGFDSHLGGHLGFDHLFMSEAILMYLVELLIYENLYFATNFTKLSALEQKLCPFLGFDSHLGFDDFPR